jgi:adenylyltransferase/sulfurtransferase
MTFNLDQSRYERQMIIEGFGAAGQDRLSRSGVFIAGAGGLGSPLAMYLAAAGVGRLTIVDLDTVSPGNLNRQLLHWEENLGQLKTASALDKLTRINSGITVEVRPERLDADNAADLIRGHDLVLDALDNFETRKILNRACLGQGLTMIYGGVNGLSGMLSTFAPGRTACLECLFPTGPKTSVTPVLGPTPGVIASLQATEALKLLTGLGRLLYNRLLIYDGLEMTFKIIDIKSNDHCPACSG